MLHESEWHITDNEDTDNNGLVSTQFPDVEENEFKKTSYLEINLQNKAD